MEQPSLLLSNSNLRFRDHDGVPMLLPILTRLLVPTSEANRITANFKFFPFTVVVRSTSQS